MSDSRYVLFITLLCAFCNYIGWAEIPDWTIAEIPGFQSSSYADISGPQVLLNGTNSLGQSGTFLFNAFTETSTYQQTWGPAFRDKDMSGSYIVWEGDDYPKQIYLYDGNSTRVISGAVYDAYRPAISGNYVVWDGHATETSSWGIFLYDISSDTTTNITNYNNGFGATHADISGNKIVWPQGVISPDSEAGQMEIFLYDITTGLTTRVTNDPDPTPQEADTGELNDNYPKISGDNIAWQRGNVNVCQIMLNGTPLTSVDQRTIADSLDISGTNCVWLERDQVNPQWNTHTLYFSDGATAVPMTEPILNTQYGYPAISGNNVVWVQEDSPSKVYLALADGLTDYHWIDDAGGQWNDADNWDQEDYPDSDYAHVVFHLNNTYTVSDYSSSAWSALFSGGTVTFDGGTSLTLGDSFIGNKTLTVDSSLNWNAGTLNSYDSFLGTSSTGTMSLSNPSLTISNWNNKGDLNVGDYYTSTLNVIDGGVINLSGPINVLRAGYHADGNVNVNGGRITAEQFIHIGHDSTSSGEMLVTGATSLVEQINDTGGLFVGVSGDGLLRVENGGQVKIRKTMSLAENEGSNGNVTVDGTNSLLQVYGNSFTSFSRIGQNSDAQLTIRNGGMADLEILHLGCSIEGIVGKIIVVDSGSELHAGSVAIGLAGSGSIDIKNEGKAYTSDLYLGYMDQGIPTNDVEFQATESAYRVSVNNLTGWGIQPDTVKAYMFVHNPQSEADVAGNIWVGYKDSSFLAVNDQGYVGCNSLTIGKTDSSTRVDTSATVWVDDPGSILGIAGSLSIYAPTLTTDLTALTNDLAGLLISDDADVTCTNATIGKSVFVSSDPEIWEPWSGKLKVTGAGSTLDVLNTLTIGNSGDALVDILNGGVVTAGTSVDISGHSPEYGGSVYIGTGSILQAPEINVHPYGHLLGSGTVIGNVNNLGGHVAPGFSPGTLTIQGDYTQDDAGVLDIEIGPDSQDILNVTGNVTIAGSNIRMTFVRGYAPSTGETISFLQGSGTVKAKPSPQYEIVNLADGFSYTTQVEGGVVQLLAQNDAVYVPTPDLDNSDFVDMADYAYFAQEWLTNNCGTCYGADLTGDGNVGVADFVQFIDSWMMGVTP